MTKIQFSLQIIILEFQFRRFKYNTKLYIALYLTFQNEIFSKFLSAVSLLDGHFAWFRMGQ